MMKILRDFGCGYYNLTQYELKKALEYFETSLNLSLQTHSNVVGELPGAFKRFKLSSQSKQSCFVAPEHPLQA